MLEVDGGPTILILATISVGSAATVAAVGTVRYTVLVVERVVADVV